MKNVDYKNLSLKEFDKAAAKFDDNDPSVYNLCRKDYLDVFEEVSKEPFSDLLDAGCGTGAMLQLFHKDLPQANYTGIDLSEKMIEVAGRKQIENGRFVLRDMASKRKFMMWFFNHIEIPLINRIAKKGDVHVHSREDIQKLCDMSGLQLESYEVRKFFRLHCVVRKTD